MPITETQFTFPYDTTLYRGKVRDVYTIEDKLLVIIATDRISAFDVVLGSAIPHKGQVLNQTAAYFLNRTRDVCPNHLLAVPDPNVTIGLKCEAFPIEVVVRAHLVGHAWRVYKEGKRELCGVALPDGMRENDAFPEPIVTPSTKSVIGHDVDITEKEITKSGLLTPEEYATTRHYAMELFAVGQRMAREQGLILADTKYEFGEQGGRIYLLDEIHTPDSSRYFYADGFEERQAKGERQTQLSKEFVREWLMGNGFQGLEGQTVPVMPAEFVTQVSERYIELYEKVTGLVFEPRPEAQVMEDIYTHTLAALRQLGL